MLNCQIPSLIIPPFRIPYPFRDAAKEPNSIVIKPTYGDFLNNYRNSSDLHIGVTDSTGFIYEYDVNGVVKGKIKPGFSVFLSR
ncbi:MKRN2 opposite strand protein [Trichonephila clavata]|uniref:MKRN2 opposite strand protein n=1 Tax=Trichonephila clavata TaxID=2740835 RepID=A0A8X6GC29_TRICU|nr:MKRN2 opposite strand protein [Trichonephila clavata]